MRNELRWEDILKHVNDRGYLTVKELSDLVDASIITIRRDLVQLDRQNRLKRTHGGAASLKAPPKLEALPGLAQTKQVSRMIIDRVDALITSDALTGLIPASIGKFKIPIVGESMLIPEAETCVEVDNYSAGFDLGCWAGDYAAEKWARKAIILDLTYHRTNTQERSRGFLDGVRSILPKAELRFSINTQSRIDMAYQLTRDALSIHSDINIIFAINDTSALGAYQACKDLKIPTDKLIILPFGLEGPTMLDLIGSHEWFVAGLAMFPEIVAAVCIEAVIAVGAQRKLPPRLSTPYCIITQANLNTYYAKTPRGWKLRWPDLPCELHLPLSVDFSHPETQRRLPKRIGFLYTYIEHEWYQTLVRTMSDYCARLGIQLEVMDFEKTQKDELQLRRQEIARRAGNEIKEGDTIFIDAGVISRTLAEQLPELGNLTVITNSLEVIQALSEKPAITLIATGGALRRSSQVFVGPTAEATLKEFHIDKLFLMVSGVSSKIGLTHTNISEVTIKQQMIRSSREVILLADHTCFQEEALMQVAPISVVHRLITDDALPVSIRLEMGTKGIQVILATM